jgi:hypothetical protein
MGGLTGWFLTQQSGSMFAEFDCTRAGTGPMLAIGMIGATIVIFGGIISANAWRHSPNPDAIEARPLRFVAGTGALAAGIFTLAIVFQTMSALIIPRCHA